jgi:hypothetical protein
MRILGSLLIALLLVGCGTMKTTTEGDAIEKVDISTVADYDGEKIAVQVTSIDLTKLFELYPSLADKNVGLGFA